MKDDFIRVIFTLGLFIFGVLCSSKNVFADPYEDIPLNNLQEQAETEYPVLIGTDGIYADIDTVQQVLYVMIRDELWNYDLRQEQWNKLHTFDQQEIEELFQDPKDFGYDHLSEKIYFWSTGVGLIYELDLESYELKRLDKSFEHKNQFGHVPFFYNGMIHAFGGYGFWEDKNLITYYLPDLREWKILTPAKDSKYPTELLGANGVYVKDQNAFFVYGGSFIKNRGHDDGNSIRAFNKELWKFDFGVMKWSHVKDFDLNDGRIIQSFGAFSSEGLGRSSLSSSAYSTHTGNWYLPVKNSEGNRPALFFKTLGLKDQKNYELFDMDRTKELEIIATNFMFDQKSQELILLGFLNITNDIEYPIMVIKVPESDILANLIPSDDNNVLLLGSLFAVGALLVLGFLVIRYKDSIPMINGQRPTISLEELTEGLNNTEKLLLKTIMESDQMPETNDLEEMVWPDVDNYDYRRKLRNETIRSINKKTQDIFSIQEKLIIRQRDIEDSRRYHYGINEELDLG